MAFSARKDWFAELFGFPEGEYDITKRQLQVEEDPADPGMKIMKGPNGRTFRAGRFSTPSLAELRACPECAAAVKGKLRVTNVIGDVAAKLADRENRHATFQVASQFNCLEFVGPSVTPEHGITGYVMDRTQGPACSIACGPATAFRNYFAPVRRPDGKWTEGQRKELQIENLEDLSAELCRMRATPGDKLGVAPFFQVRGGYSEADSGQLKRLNAFLETLGEDGLDRLRSKLRIGVHADVEVTSMAWGAKLLNNPDQLVTQVFGSACAVGYSRDSTKAEWEKLATLILEASYEATLLAALRQSVRHRGGGGSKKVFLTLLGGGVFGNSIDWIIGAMHRAFSCLRHADLDVHIVTYAGSPAPGLIQLEEEFSPKAAF